MKRIVFHLLFPFLLLSVSCSGAELTSDPILEEESQQVELRTFLDLILGSDSEKAQALLTVESEWDSSYVAPILDLISLQTAEANPQRLFELLARKTGQDHGFSTNAWYKWLWSFPENTPAFYPEFKKHLFLLLDRKFEAYFGEDRPMEIRLDEVRWGGVGQDGIPPLHSPKMIAVDEATYLDDDNIVFGFEVNGDFRAYPKRILAWHEMFTDNIGGVALAGVYCTLCGSMILYETEFHGVQHQMGTSGFLYRSNKLMYDQATQSLWNTILGTPVIGPLVGQGIEFKFRPVVTTTWGAWKRKHPNTTVLSLATGFQRNYDEGVAYQAYFSTDDLMFNTPFTDHRLPNKAEVLALRFPDLKALPIALSTDYLLSRPIYHNHQKGMHFVILTDRTGASRVYKTGGLRFKSWDRKSSATDSNKMDWQVTEEALVSEDGQKLERLPAHRAFWFGWLAAHPNTLLVK